ncbi:MAG: hypothetical protein PHI12_07360 [Dehalococcoidales bacterium]|nr:hypothetical protein [Dehalococcoidales bacterium]
MPNAELNTKPTLKTINPEYIPHVLEEGELGCSIEWAVTDPKTKRVSQHVVKRSESYVRQFLDLLYAQMRISQQSDKQSIRDTGNTLRDVFTLTDSSGGITFDVLAGAGVVTFGIVVGTGVVAPTINDYALGTPIAHGVGAGQLQYSAITFGAPSSDATTSQLTITRNFANGSGGDITITEVGLYCRANDGVAARYFCIIRDVIGAGILVPNGSTLTINYRPQATI